MRIVPVLLLLAACPRTTTPEVGAASTAPEPLEQPTPVPSEPPEAEPELVRPIEGPEFLAFFAFEDGQSARLTQTLIEQTSLPGMMASRVTIDSEQHFQVRADGANFSVRQDVETITVDMEGPDELIAPLERSLAHAMQISPAVIIDAQGAVQDVIVPQDQIAAARADIRAIAQGADPLVLPAIEQAAEALLDPENLVLAGENGVAPWNVGERRLPFQASETVGDRRYLFAGWVPCAEGESEPSCGVLLAEIAASDDEIDAFGDTLTAQFAELPEEERPIVGEVMIDERYLFVLEPDSGRVRRSAHDKRTTAILDMQGQALPYVKNLSTAEIWTWDSVE